MRRTSAWSARIPVTWRATAATKSSAVFTSGWTGNAAGSGDFEVPATTRNLSEELDRAERGSKIVGGCQQGFAHANGLSECLGVLRLGHKRHALDGERRVVREPIEQSP